MAERTVRLLADGVLGYSRSVAPCPGCGRRILWCRLAAGHVPIAFDDLELSGLLSEHGRIETVSARSAHRRTCTCTHPFRR